MFTKKENKTLILDISEKQTSILETYCLSRIT